MTDLLLEMETIVNIVAKSGNMMVVRLIAIAIFVSRFGMANEID
jgi:hypothetical protein